MQSINLLMLKLIYWLLRRMEFLFSDHSHWMVCNACWNFSGLSRVLLLSLCLYYCAKSFTMVELAYSPPFPIPYMMDLLWYYTPHPRCHRFHLELCSAFCYQFYYRLFCRCIYLMNCWDNTCWYRFFTLRSFY